MEATFPYTIKNGAGPMTAWQSLSLYLSPHHGCLVSVDVPPVRAMEGETLTQTGADSQLVQESSRPEQNRRFHSKSELFQIVIK